MATRTTGTSTMTASSRAEQHAKGGKAAGKQKSLEGRIKDVVREEEATDIEPQAIHPFPFLSLPFELRLRIYDEILLVHKTIDLNPLNHYDITRRLAIFYACHQVHEEAYHVFYNQTIRLFPTHGRFFHTKKPLIARLPPRYRNAITTVELRLGPGWSAPPRGQHTGPSLGLADCTNLRTLKLFIECDPSESVFTGFRGKGATEDTYRYFCINLLLSIFEQVPSLRTVEIDAYPSVKKDSPMVLGFVRYIQRADKRLAWGSLRGWDKDGDEPGLVGLESALASMNISEAPRLVEITA